MKKGFAPILVIIILILFLLPIAYLVNKQFLGYRLPWEQKPFHDGNICGDGKITFGECPNSSPVGISGKPETVLLDVSSDGSTIAVQLGTIIDVKFDNSSDWTKPVSSDNSVVSTIEASAATDGSATGRFHVIKQGTVTLTAEGACKKAPPGYSNCLAIQLWKVTIVSSNATSDETVNWKTYTSNKWGFRVNYPKEWIEPLEKNDGVQFSNEDGGSLSAIVVDFNFDNSSNAIRDYNKIKSYEINKEVTEWNGYLQNLTRLSDSTLEGYQTIRYKIAPHYTENGLGNESDYGIYFSKNSKIYHIEEAHGQEAVNHTLIFDQILSTFKFLN